MTIDYSLETTEVTKKLAPLQPKELASLGAKSVASELDGRSLASRKGDKARLLGDPGKTSIQLLSRAAARVSSATKGASILAKGASAFTQRSWKTVRIKPTRTGRKALRRRGRLRAIVRVTVKLGNGAKAVSTKAVLVR